MQGHQETAVNRGHEPQARASNGDRLTGPEQPTAVLTAITRQARCHSTAGTPAGSRQKPSMQPQVKASFGGKGLPSMWLISETGDGLKPICLLCAK